MIDKSENTESWKLIHSGDEKLFTSEQISEIADCIKYKGEPLETMYFNIGFIAGLVFPIDKPKNGSNPLDVIEYHNRALLRLSLKLLLEELENLAGDD